MKGLLKFCIEATRSEDAPGVSADPEASLAAMDPARRAWLEEAVSNMSVDAVQELAQGVRLLLDPGVDTAQKEEVLESLEDCLGTIDMAANFHKIGGFPALAHCLQSPVASLRSGAAHLIGELAQNNPYCQEKLLAEGFIKLLLDQLDNDSDSNCKVKALYAISCTVREHKEGLAELGTLDGWSVIIRALQCPEDSRLGTKACFLISSAAQVDHTLLDEMVSRGLVLHLAQELGGAHLLCHEHVLATLLLLVKGSGKAREEAAMVQGLQESLGRRVRDLEGREEDTETVDYCQHLLKELGMEQEVDR